MLAYRSDIDGLRAVAVVAVILFHAGVTGFPGGYVGVDVFFVISGFLIASIILRELDNETFSVAAFYERRIRRIFPPLFVVLGVTWITAYFVLLPSGMVALGKTMLAATLFVSNFVFCVDAGYFGGGAETKPLLHTWSLCVEEQFYMLFPLVLAALYRYRRPWLSWVTAALAGISLGLSVWGVSRTPEASFFLAHSRAWELLLGALLALRVLPLIERPVVRHMLGLAGLAAILYAALRFNARTPFPGLHALVPCLGTAALIHAGTGGVGIVNRLLSLRIPVSVGLVSYGLYLWHWPLLVLAREATLGTLGSTKIALCLLATVLLSGASYYLIEKPVRERRVLTSRGALFGAATAAMVGASALALLPMKLDGFPGRLPAHAMAYATQAGGSKPIFERYCRAYHGRRTSKHCVIGAPNAKRSFVVWGDSHAAASAPAIAMAGIQTHRAGLLRVENGCRPLLGVRVEGVRVEGGSSECERFNDLTAARVKSKAITDVVLVGRWGLSVEGTGYKHEYGLEHVITDKASREASVSRNPAVFRRGMTRTLTALAKDHKRVIVTLPVPEVGLHVPATFARMVWWGQTLDLRPTRSEYEKRQRRTLSILRDLQKRFGFDVVDPTKVLCGAKFCEVERDGKLFYKDDDHLTDRAARRLVPQYARLLARRDATLVDDVTPAALDPDAEPDADMGR